MKKLSAAWWRYTGHNVVTHPRGVFLCNEVAGARGLDYDSYALAPDDPDVARIALFTPDQASDEYVNDCRPPFWMTGESEGRALAAYLIAAMIDTGDA